MLGTHTTCVSSQVVGNWCTQWLPDEHFELATGEYYGYTCMGHAPLHLLGSLILHIKDS